MRSNINVSEIARLTALVKSVPIGARKEYEWKVLNGRILKEVLDDWKAAVKWKRWVVYISPAFLLLVIALIFMFRRQVAEIPAFPFFAMAVLALGLLAFALTMKREARCEKKILECKSIFADLEKRLADLGLHAKDLIEEQVGPRLHFLAVEYREEELRFRQARKADHISDDTLSDVYVTERKADKMALFDAVASANLFGFQQFTWAGLTKWAQHEVENRQAMAKPG